MESETTDVLCFIAVNAPCQIHTSLLRIYCRRELSNLQVTSTLARYPSKRLIALPLEEGQQRLAHGETTCVSCARARNSARVTRKMRSHGVAPGHLGARKVCSARRRGGLLKRLQSTLLANCVRVFSLKFPGTSSPTINRFVYCALLESATI